MARTSSAPPQKSSHPSSNLNGRIPAALRNHTPSDGLYKIVSLDLGTGYTCIHIADLQVHSGKFTNLESLDPKHFYRYPGNPNHRPELTAEVPTICAHIPGETDESKAQHGYEVDSAGDETGAVIVDRMKEALYSGPEAKEQNGTLKDLALKIPYLVSRYKDTKLAAHPEIWMLADYILSLTELVTLRIVEEGFQGDLVWVCTIPSNWDKNSIKLYSLVLDASPFLVGKYILQSEIESAIAGLMHQFSNQVRMEDGDVFFALDIGKGTSDFSVSRQTHSNPVQVEEIMPPAALFAGSSTVLRLWESHIHELCKKEAEEDPGRFESDLAAQKARFTDRMHMYTGLSGEEVDKVYYICGQKIKITRDQMKSWFDEWMMLTKSFISQQCKNYYTRTNSDPPTKFFLIGGSSNAVVLQKCINGLFEKPFFRNTRLILMGDCNSATLVAYGAITRAVTSIMSTRKSHYWIGFTRKEPFDRIKHHNVPEADIVIENVPDETGWKRETKEYVKTIQWWTQPGEICTVDGPIEQMPSISMAESFDEEGSVIGQPTDYKVPLFVYICPSLNKSDVKDNDTDDIADNVAGTRGWSYQSTRPKTEGFDFEIDFSPKLPYPLLIADELVPVNEFYDVNWTIFAETTGIGIDFWCAVHPSGQVSRKETQLNVRIVSRVLFTDLVGVIQQSYNVRRSDVEIEDELEQMGGDEPDNEKELGGNHMGERDGEIEEEDQIVVVTGKRQISEQLPGQAKKRRHKPHRA